MSVAFHWSVRPRDLPSFPTRRSSDLIAAEHDGVILAEPPDGRIPERLELVSHGHRLVYQVFSVGKAEKPEDDRSEEHTSELQSRGHLVCRLLLEKKRKRIRSDDRGGI